MGSIKSRIKRLLVDYPITMMNSVIFLGLFFGSIPLWVFGIIDRPAPIAYLVCSILIPTILAISYTIDSKDKEAPR